jgi:hypothetical protein
MFANTLIILAGLPSSANSILRPAISRTGPSSNPQRWASGLKRFAVPKRKDAT